MNNCNFIGRLTRDPEVRYTQGEKPLCVTRFTLAVDKATKNQGADFLAFKALGARGEFAEKYLKKGMKVGIRSRAHADSYEKNGQKIYFTEFICEEFTFCDGKAENNNGSSDDSFMDIHEGYEGELPFN